MNVEKGLTLFNLFNFTVLFGLYIKLYHIDGMTKYEIVDNMRDTCNNIVGKEINDKYGIYFITSYHYPAIISTLVALVLVNNLKYFIINFLFITFIGYTNLIFKGCLVRKYERQLLNGEDSYATKLMNKAFDIYFSLFNIEPSLNNKIVGVFYIFFTVYVALAIKMIYLLSRQ